MRHIIEMIIVAIIAFSVWFWAPEFSDLSKRGRTSDANTTEWGSGERVAAVMGTYEGGEFYVCAAPTHKHAKVSTESCPGGGRWILAEQWVPAGKRVVRVAPLQYVQDRGMAYSLTFK